MTGNEGRTGTHGGPRRGQGGFTLIEIMVAMIVLVGAMLGLAYSMVVAWRMDRASNERKIALQWATAQMENIKAMGYANVSAEPPAGYLIPNTWTSYWNVGWWSDWVTYPGVERFVRFYYGDPMMPDYTSPYGQVVKLYDPMLNGLPPQRYYRRTGEVWFQMPVGSTGVSGTDGYWVTVRVFWKGVSGDSELKLYTFLAR